MGATKQIKQVANREKSKLEIAANEAAQARKTYGQWQAAQYISQTKIIRKW